MKKKIIYLANPYGFSSQQKQILLPKFIRQLQSMGAEVWEPFERNNQIDFTAHDWAYQVGQSNLQDIRKSDAIFAIINGSPPDEGVMIELGIAIALGKPVFLFRDDFRMCSDNGVYPLNLMIFIGFPQDDWKDYLYNSIDNITDPNRALAKWLQQVKVH